ncbi:50S ribosomal protein L22 [Desulfovibrio cuneatus]|uniref:50S ribosomal protein L22 n=1 Tax=Desulfovibrio cuneatus TaxID=159728 RepID=UPI0012ECA296|nr:50S ribosomal protein L22 [Desulfovibrio cuneatus]
MMPRASLKAVRVSPRKASLVARNVVGKRVGDALNILQFTPQKAAGLIRQVMYSALSNASNNDPHQKAGIDVDGLVVKQVIVSEGPSWKRFMPRAQGRATQIIKRTSHITVILAEG